MYIRHFLSIFANIVFVGTGYNGALDMSWGCGATGSSAWYSNIFVSLLLSIGWQWPSVFFK